MASPGNKMRFDLKPEDIKRESEQLMVKSKNIYDEIGMLSDDQVTMDNVVKVNLTIISFSKIICF